jgi:hypothetical protein
MNTIRIEILNPKAARLLKDLADLKLISIRKDKENDFSAFLEKLRSKMEVALTPEEISKEVQIVRATRYAR